MEFGLILIHMVSLICEYFHSFESECIDESFYLFIYNSVFFYTKWFEPSMLFGFHFFPPHLPMSGLSPSGKHIEVLEGGQEKETTGHFMVASADMTAVVMFGLCGWHTEVIFPDLPNYLLPFQTSLLITSSSLSFSSSSGTEQKVKQLSRTLLQND